MANFNDIEQANKTIKTTNIKGKQYAEVNQRIRAFRMLYPEGFIRTDIVEMDLTAGIVVMKSVVGYTDETGAERILGTGTAFEWKNDSKSMVNKTSYIENCETSAVGRALGMIGLGIEKSIASAEEVKYAVAHQDEMQTPTPDPAPANVNQLICERCGKPIPNHGKASAQKVADATKAQFGKMMCWDCGHLTKEENAAKVDPIAEAEAAAMALPFPIPD